MDDFFKDGVANMPGLSPLSFLNHSNNPKAKIPRILAKSPTGEYSAVGVHFVDYSQTLHSITIGGTGSGKTLVLKQNIADAISNAAGSSQKIVIFDLKGDLVTVVVAVGELCGIRVYIFHPSNKRACPWDIQADTGGRYDTMSSIAREFVPISEASGDTFWYEGALAILELIFSGYMNAGVDFGIHNIYNFVNQCSDTIVEILSKVLKGNPLVARFFETADNQKVREGILVTLTVALQRIQASAIQQLHTPRYRHQGIVDILNRDTPAVLVFGADMAHFAYQKAVLRAQFNVIANWVLGRDETKPLSAVNISIDELPEFGKGFNKVVELAAFGRTKNCRLSVTAQNYGQLIHQFGAEMAATLVGNCDLKTVLATNDKATAEWAASISGGREKLRPGYSAGSNSLSVSWNYGTVPNVRPEDIYAMKKASPNNGLEYYLHSPYVRPAIGHVSSSWLESRKPPQIRSDRYFSAFTPEETFFRFWNPVQDFRKPQSYQSIKRAYIAAGSNPVGQLIRQEVWNYFESLSGAFIDELIRQYQ